MMRAMALPMLLFLVACSALTPAKTDATAFRNPQNGTVVGGCGPMQGFEGAVSKAQEGCQKAWEAKGWIPVNRAVASLPE